MRDLLLPALAMLLVLAVLPAFAEPAPAGETRLFDVGALLAVPAEPAVPALDLGGEVLEFLDPKGDWIEPPRFLDELELPELVAALADPEVFAGEDGHLEVAGKWLSVRAPAATLDRVAAVLDALFAEASRRVEVSAEWALLSAAAADRLEKAGVLAALRRGRVDAAARAAVLAEAGTEGSLSLAGTVVARPGCLAMLRQTTSTSYVADLDVEVAQGSRVADPVVRFAPEGWLLALRPTLLADGSVLVEAIHQTAALDGPIRRIAVEAEPFGTIDLPALGIERFLATGRARPGETLATVREGGRGDRPVAVLLLTPRVAGGAPAGGPVTFLPARALLRGRTALGALFPDAEDEVDEERPFPPDLLFAPRLAPQVRLPLFADALLLADHFAVSFPGEGAPDASPAGLCYPSGDPRIDPARQALGTLENAAARSYRVHLVLENRGAAGEPQGSSGIHLGLAAGAETLFEAGTERAFIADQEVEVAQECRTGDPVVRRAFGGLTAVLRVDPAPDGGAFSGRATIVLTDLDPAFEVRRPGLVEVGVFEAARSRQVVVDREFAGRPGEPIVLDAGRRPDGSRLSVKLTVEEP